jgi:hypothetical protein
MKVSLVFHGNRLILQLHSKGNKLQLPFEEFIGLTIDQQEAVMDQYICIIILEVLSLPLVR